MPKKNRKRKRPAKPDSGKPKKFELSSFGVPVEEHAEFKQAVLKAAQEGVAEFPKILDRFGKLFRDREPIGVLASLAMYSLSGFVTREGTIKKPGSQIEQHHVELVQAVMMGVPAEEWGRKPVTPDVMEWVFDDTPKLANTFLFQRLLIPGEDADEQAKTLVSLQFRMRLHTQAVRNWGYYSDVIRISKELHAPLDAAFTAKLGFGIADLIDVMAALVTEYERRSNEHWNTLAKVVRGKSVQELVRLYYKYVPDLEGDPAGLIATFPPGVTREGVMGYLMGHFDLRLSGRATFTPAEVAAISGRLEDVVDRILRAVSRPPGDLAGANPDHLFLSNPVWTAPGLDLGDRYFFAVPQVVFSHINSIIRGLAEKAEIADALERRRSKFLETKLEEILRSALPSAKITSAVEWEIAGAQGETDVLVVLDRVVVIAEAKSQRLTPEALRGAPARMKKHVQDLVVGPSLQSARLENFLESAKAGDADARKLMEAIGIEPDKVDRTIRLSVTLDDLSVLSSAENDFKVVGWVPADHHLAPTIHLADLECIVDILDNPLLILHYLSERTFLQKSFELLGDELDFLGLYLGSGFNLAALEAHEGTFAPSGMSAPIDRYYESRDAGIKLAKPKADVQPLYRAILDRLTERKPTGWTMAGLHLLSSGDAAEQRSVENGLNKVRALVRKDFRDPKHINSLQIEPRSKRKAKVIFHVFPEAHRAKVKQNMEALAIEALDDGDHDDCVVFARCVENWDKPYEAVLIVGQSDAEIGAT